MMSTLKSFSSLARQIISFGINEKGNLKWLDFIQRRTSEFLLELFLRITNFSNMKCFWSNEPIHRVK